MIKDDINLSVAINFLDRKIAKLNMKIVDNPEDMELKENLNKYLNMRKEISKGNAELIKKIIDDAKSSQNDWFKR